LQTLFLFKIPFNPLPLVEAKMRKFAHTISLYKRSDSKVNLHGKAFAYAAVVPALFCGAI